MNPQIQAFFDPATATITYVVHEATPGGACAIIDSVLDFDPKSGRTSTASADRVADYVRERQLRTLWLLETHAHADHLSAAPYLQRQLGGVIAIGQSIQTVQGVFKKILNLEPGFQLDGSQFGHLFADGETFRIGELTATAIHVPGHTPADMAYLIGDAAFVGDTLFIAGRGHCALRLSRRRRPPAVPLDPAPLEPARRHPAVHVPRLSARGARSLLETSVADQRRANIHVRDGISEAEFVAMRTKRDATLSMPTLILPAIQVNIRAGHFPPAEDNGVRYLKIPVDAL